MAMRFVSTTPSQTRIRVWSHDAQKRLAGAITCAQCEQTIPDMSWRLQARMAAVPEGGTLMDIIS